MRPAAYLRVSSQMQMEANGTDSQRHAIETWCRAHEVSIPSPHWFSDEGISGATMRRPGWEAMMRAVHAKEIDTIVLYDLSRAGRTLKGLAEWIEDMTDRQVRVVFVAAGLDISTAIGRLVAQILGAVAEYDRLDKAERVSAGIRAKIAKGEKWGAGRVMMGSTGPAGKPRRTGLVFDEATWRRLYREWQGSGQTIHSFAKAQKLPLKTAYTHLTRLRDQEAALAGVKTPKT
jgi:DNA invertase Pin-like site-specific DNA recombinase